MKTLLIIIVSCVLLPYVAFAQMTPPAPEPSTEAWMLFLDPVAAPDIVRDLGPMLHGRAPGVLGDTICIDALIDVPFSRPFYRWYCFPSSKVLYLKENNTGGN